MLSLNGTVKFEQNHVEFDSLPRSHGFSTKFTRMVVHIDFVFVEIERVLVNIG